MENIASRQNRPMICRWLVVSATGLATALLWDISGFDIELAKLFGGGEGFPLRHVYALEKVLHTGARNLGWLVLFALTAGAIFPFGALRFLTTRERIQLPATILLCVAVITLIKLKSHTSCPWELQIFGGLQPFVSHWNFNKLDGGGGRCFPAGHASTGFAFIGGYFAIQRRSARLANYWLSGAMAAGIVLGISQQLRGAHFASHTLWTAWICWTLSGLIDVVCHSGVWKKSKRLPIWSGPSK